MMDQRHLQILRHALGLDRDGRGTQYRNHFCAGGKDEDDCRELIALGLMKQHATTDLFPYFNCSVTEAGVAVVNENAPPPIKRTKAQKRYERFLDWRDIYCGTFREFLQYEKEQRCSTS